MRLNSIGSIRQSPMLAAALAAVLAVCAGVAATGMTRPDQPDPALAIARIAAPSAEGTAPPHTIGLTADYFAAIGISGQRDLSPGADAKTFTAPTTPPPERLARRRAAPDESGRARACGDSSVSLAAAKTPPTTES
jgi:hypothetical protein